MTEIQPGPAAVHASGPTDLLALVPGFLGFHPTDSVVLLTLGDAPTPFHARVDLPADPVTLEELTDYLARVAHRHGARTLAVLVYTDDAGLAEHLVDDLAARLERRGGEVLCAVRADGGRWWALGRGGGGPGTPYDLALHPLTVQAVVDGTVVLGSRRELVDSLRADPAGTAEVQPRVVAAAQRLASRDPRPPGRRGPLGRAAGPARAERPAPARPRRRGAAARPAAHLRRAARRRLGRDDPRQRARPRGPVAGRRTAGAGGAAGGPGRPARVRGLALRARRARLVRGRAGPGVGPGPRPGRAADHGAVRRGAADRVGAVRDGRGSRCSCPERPGMSARGAR